MPARPIPFARNSSHCLHIQDILACVLRDLKEIPVAGARVLWVSCRLNRTGQTDSPVFCGWVEDVEATAIRLAKGQPYAPLELRFGDTHPSRLFSDCLKVSPGDWVRRDWSKPPQADPTSQRIGESFYGETHRRSVPILIDRVYAGTLNAAFLGDPSAKDDEIKARLVSWSQKPASELVRYVRTNLAYSGPPHPP
ncbi:MAG TPA: hypothetical protein VNN77_19810 [candidate division Zixibacteria bacterium]|nr:hypothetical protein [candidate division Zixibacteria bacterium]